MRLILLTIVVYVSFLAAEPSRTTRPIGISEARSQPKADKSNRRLHPLGFLRRLGKAESDLAFRLSSWGIQPEVAATKPEAPPHPSASTEASLSTRQGPLSGGSQ